MSGLESIKKVDCSIDNISELFENQRKNLKNDILFLKEDTLKEFREIETKLNTKYEKINSNIITKFHKFEINLESMNDKIAELSNLIFTENNIHKKIANLYEFKANISDSLMTQSISIRNNEFKIKEAINKYDQLLNDSIIYPGVIGKNGRFSNFHHLLDYVLVNINEFVTFKEKNVIDYQGYKTKIELLLKSLKMQADSITIACNKYADKIIIESEKRMKNIINSQDNKFYDLKLENNETTHLIDNKIEDINGKILLLLNTKAEMDKKYDEELYILKNYYKIVSSKFDNFEKQINSLKELFDCLCEIGIENNVNNKLNENEKNIQ
jgi:hypothetical protein